MNSLSLCGADYLRQQDYEATKLTHMYCVREEMAVG